MNWDELKAVFTGHVGTQTMNTGLENTFGPPLIPLRLAHVILPPFPKKSAFPPSVSFLSLRLFATFANNRQFSALCFFKVTGKTSDPRLQPIVFWWIVSRVHSIWKSGKPWITALPVAKLPVAVHPRDSISINKKNARFLVGQIFSSVLYRRLQFTRYG